MQRIGIYGGTFNPPHVGHIRAARNAIAALSLDRLYLIPTGSAPHKRLPDGSPTPRQRLDMLRIAVADIPQIMLSDMELRREGISYTCETVAQLRREHPDAELYLLMGTDMFLSFPTWKDPEKMIGEVTLCVLGRGERDEQVHIEKQKAALEALGARVTVIQSEVTVISSTQLRRMLAFSCADAFLPAGVGDYIRENGLYDTNANWRNLPMEQLEPIVVRLLKPSRVAHVLGCRDTAVRLAERWGANETDAARAGLLHDITKALDGPLQLTLCSAYGKILDDFSRNYPKTLHALTGSLVAQRIFGENDAVTAAICHHTTGKADMTLLEKIIYVADYIEPNRDIPGVDRLRALAFTDIDAALKLGLQMTLEHLKRQGSEVSPESRDALRWLNETT